MKVHCHWQWRADSTTSGSKGAAEERERMSEQARVVWESPGVLLERSQEGGEETGRMVTEVY